MKPLPEAEIYEKGLEYWPYKTSLAYVLAHVVEHAPLGASVLDVMCGPGYLLGKIAERRPDLKLRGVDIDQRYIAYGRERYKDVTFHYGDIAHMLVEPQADVVLCTGSLHHVAYEQQEQAIRRLRWSLKHDGFAIISDCYIDNYNDERGRELAAAKLGYEYLKATIENGAPIPVVGWTADILWNDVMMAEYKTSVNKRINVLRKYFVKVNAIRVWPTEDPGDYGDYVHICCSL